MIRRAAQRWNKFCAAAPGNARTAWEKLAVDPRERTDRRHPLKGSLGVRVVNGVEMAQRQ